MIDPSRSLVTNDERGQFLKSSRDGSVVHHVHRSVHSLDARMPPVASAASAPRVAARPSALRRDHPRSRTTATTKPRASSAEEGVRASPSVSQIPDFASATAVVWDVDGTLADTTDLGFASTNAVLLEASLPTITLEQYLRGTRYATPQRLAWHATGDIDDPSGEALGAAFDEHYIALVDDRTAGFFPGIRDLVRRIASGKSQAVLSNACGEYARKVCDANEMIDAMAAVVGADEVPDVKPSPLGLLSLCSSLGWDPATCVYVGDSPSDGVAAKGAGMMSVGCTWGSHDANAQRGRFDALVDTVEELEALLLGR